MSKKNSKLDDLRSHIDCVETNLRYLVGHMREIVLLSNVEAMRAELLSLLDDASEMPGVRTMIMIGINPKFASWFQIQSNGVRNDIEAKWDETGTHDDIAHGDPHGVSARQHRTVMYCVEKHGYDYP